MFNLGYIAKKEINKHNLNWPEFSDNPYTILIVRGSGFGKTNGLLHQMNH